MDKSASGAEQPAVVPFDGRDHPDRLGQLVDLDPLERTVFEDAGAGDPAGQDVDRQHLVPAGVPADALTELGLPGGADDSGVQLVFFDFHHEPPKSTTTLMSSGPRVRASAMFWGGTRRVIRCPSHPLSADANVWAAL